MRSSLILLSALSLSISTPCFEYIQNTTTHQIQTPSFSSRKTAKIKLDNGLEAYIISDPLLKESGAALSVGCGSWDDPAEYPGMAHFLEHMLFMGTKAYPDEAEYSSFIQSHGGAMNAYTASDKTVYSFSINPPDFDAALDRFSHFFIDPLFSRNSISRELHNVDQEHAKNVENDGSRVYMVFKDTTNPNHPNHAFSTGNADTLSGIPQDVMKDFYNKYYSADRMHLVVMDKAPLNTLIASVEEKFSEVPVSQFKRQLPSTSLFSDAQKGALLTICPLRETKSLSLIWELEDQFVNDLQNKTADFLSYLVSSEAKGQLADVLKSKGYINSLSSSKDKFSKDQGLFSIDMDLSDRGIDHKEDVIRICFNYLDFLLKNISEDVIFNQWKSIITTRYVYQDRQDVFDFVTDVAGDLIDDPLQSFPEEGLIPQSFEKNKFQALIKSLTPSDCLYILLNNKGDFTKKEPWTGAMYSINKWPESKLDKFDKKEPHLIFSQVELNPYAPSQFYLTSKDSESEFYETLENSKNFKLLYQPTNLYGLPEYCLKLKLTPSIPMHKEDLSAFMSLFVQAFNRKMMFDLDAASYCGLKARLSASEGSFWFNLEGFNDKSLVLFSKLMSNFKDFSFDKEDFELIRQLTKESLSNTSKDLGFRQGLMRFSSLFDSTSALPQEVSASIKTWDYDRFSRTCKDIRSHFAVEGLIIGNAPKDHADAIKDQLKECIYPKDMPESRLVKVLDLDDQKGPYIYKKNLSVQGSSLILAIQQEKVTPQTRAKTALLIPVLSEQFFDTLRTKQHTGYIARAFDKEIAQQQFYLFGVQSNSHGALELLFRFELFIEDFVNNFEHKFSNEQFQSIKNALIEDIRARKENLATLANHDMQILCYRDGDFTWDEKLLSAIQDIKYEDLQEFAFNTLPRTNHRRVAFMMDGKLPENRKLSYSPTSLEGIKLQGRFNLPVFAQPAKDADEYSKKLLGSES
jgi:insulysin